MSRKSIHLTLISAVATLTLLMAGSVAWCVTYEVVHTFSGNGVAQPSSGLIVDAAGNAYGTLFQGGGFGGAGAVYQLSPTSGYHVIYVFHGHPDGRHPQGNLVLDSAGNLYGTTVNGGAKSCPNGFAGCGTVFELSPPTNGGAWTETLLYSFKGGKIDGANPQAGVVFDPSGNLYGTTAYGANQSCQGTGPGCGTVFELKPSQSGWTETVLYQFSGGGNPFGGLVLDGSGKLYGTASTGGPRGGGTVFELSPASNGEWTYTLLYAFDASSGSEDGKSPQAGLIFDAAGDLYGTTFYGGTGGGGTVFELTLGSSGWTESILHNFLGGNDGAAPEANLVFDATGNLYGTTMGGGNPTGAGTVFKLTPGNGGQWTESLFRFKSTDDGGAHPTTPVLLHGTAELFGTTNAVPGVVFRITE